MTIQYDPSELGTVRTLFKWHGTMLPMVLRSGIFWVLLLAHSIEVLLHRLIALEFPEMQFASVQQSKQTKALAKLRTSYFDSCVAVALFIYCKLYHRMITVSISLRLRPRRPVARQGGSRRGVAPVARVCTILYHYSLSGSQTG